MKYPLFSTLWCINLNIFSFGLKILEPQSVIPFFDNVPLWLRLDFDQGNTECFSVFVDNQYNLATCDESTLIDGPLLPGNHTLYLYPTHLPTSKGNGVRFDFEVMEPSERLPSHISRDGWRLDLPECVDKFHEFWYNSGIWWESALIE